MAITLFVEKNWISPYVFACFVTLTEKNVPFEAKVLDTAKGETKTPEYLARTVTGRVPALEHDGFGIGESSAIVEYLEEVFPTPSVFPRTPRDRARFRQLSSWLRSDDTALIREERPTTTIFYQPSHRPLSQPAKAQADKLLAVAGRLLQPNQPTLFGEWSLADAELAFMLHRLICGGDAVPGPLSEWASAQWKRPSVAAFVGHERPPL